MGAVIYSTIERPHFKIQDSYSPSSSVCDAVEAPLSCFASLVKGDDCALEGIVLVFFDVHRPC